MKKKILLILMIIGLCIVCYIGGWWTRYKLWDESIICWDYACQVDDLERLKYLMEDEELPYYGMKKEDVLPLLPTPEWSGDSIKLFDDGNLDDLHWLYNPYKERLRGTHDTIMVETYSWVIPYHDRPKLYIVFEKKRDEWIVTAGVQWNPDIVDIE